MIDKRFSAGEFEKLGRDSEEANVLHEELAAEIAVEIHEAIYSVFCEIAQKLEALGHNFEEDEPEYDAEYNSWAYAFRDLGKNHELSDHKLRIHLDTQICTGYPDYYKHDDEKLEMNNNDV